MGEHVAVLRYSLYTDSIKSCLLCFVLSYIFQSITYHNIIFHLQCNITYFGKYMLDVINYLLLFVFYLIYTDQA